MSHISLTKRLTIILGCVTLLISNQISVQAQGNLCNQVPVKFEGTRNLTSDFRWINAEEIVFITDYASNDFVSSSPIIYQYNAATGSLSVETFIPAFTPNTAQDQAFQAITVSPQLKSYVYASPSGKIVVFPRQENEKTILWVKDTQSQQERILGIKIVPGQLYDPALYWNPNRKQVLVASLLGNEGNILVSFADNQITTQNLTDILPWSQYGTPFEPYFVAGVNPSWRYILVRPLSINKTLVYDSISNQITELDLSIDDHVSWLSETSFLALSGKSIIRYDLETKQVQTALYLPTVLPTTNLWNWQNQLSPTGEYVAIYEYQKVYVCRIP